MLTLRGFTNTCVVLCGLIVWAVAIGDIAAIAFAVIALMLFSVYNWGGW